MNDICKIHAGISNSLIQGAYNLSTVESRIFLLALCSIKSKASVKVGELYEVDLSMYKDICVNDSVCFYTDIKRDLKKLMSKTFMIKDKSNTIIGHFIPTIKYNDDERRVFVSFGKEVIPYISELKEQFTRIYAKDALPISGKYTYRLYSMLEMYRYKGLLGKCIINTEDLMDSWCVPKTQQEFKFFKRDILLPAIKEFNDTKLGILEASYIKNGRKVEKIEFNYILERRNAVSIISTVKESSVATEGKYTKIDLNF